MEDPTPQVDASRSGSATGFEGAESGSYDPPRFRVIPLDCEISAYAPDDGDPLF